MKTLPRLFLFLVLPLYALDQVTKWIVVLSFEAPPPGYNVSYENHVVIENFFTIVRVHNQGAAFGMGNDTPWAPFVFFLIAVVALGLIPFFWMRGAFNILPLRLAAGLMMAGILGNLTDRMLQGFFLPAYENAGFFARIAQGYVVDFLDFKIGLETKLTPHGHWPSFNVADSCICVAAFFLILSTFRGEGKVEENEADEGREKK